MCTWCPKEGHNRHTAKDSHCREFWSATSGCSPDVVKAAAGQEYPDSIVLTMVRVDDLEFEARTSLSFFFHFWSFSLSMSVFPFVVLFVELAGIMAEFSITASLMIHW